MLTFDLFTQIVVDVSNMSRNTEIMEMYEEDCNTVNGLTMQPYIPWIFDAVFRKPGCFFTHISSLNRMSGHLIQCV